MDMQHTAPAPIQPTDRNLVWERRRDARGKKFEARAGIVRHLVQTWTDPGQAAVDVSGGPGRWLDCLAPSFRRFSHLDLSPAAIDVARQEHAHLPHVEYGTFDLLDPSSSLQAGGRQMWDVAFCLDTLLYRGAFVEAAISSIHGILRPGGVAIVDFPTAFRASVSKTVKGERYNGPERTFTTRESRKLVTDAGFQILDSAFHFAELSDDMHARLGRANTRLLPYPSTWTYLVLRR